MKKSLITLLFTLSFITIFAKERIIEHPVFTSRNTKVLDFKRILISDTATVLEVEARFTPKYWIQIPSSAYLKAGDQLLRIHGGDGINVNEKFWMPESGIASFRLLFPPLPKGTQEIDFCEGDNPGDSWFTWGIRLDGKRPEVKINKKWNSCPMPEGDKLPAGKMEKGTAVLTGQIIGYTPQMASMFNLRCAPTFTTQYDISLTIANDGTFHQEIPLYGTCLLIFTTGNGFANFFMQPGETTEMLVNLPEISRKSSPLLKSTKSYGPAFCFNGSLAGINNLYQQDIRIEMNTKAEKDAFLDNISGKTATEYIACCLDMYKNKKKELSQIKNITPAGIELLSIRLQSDMMNYISQGTNYQMEAYKKTHGLAPNDQMPDEYIYPLYQKEDFKFLKESGINSPYYPNLFHTAGNFSYEQAFKKTEDPNGLFFYLIESRRLNENETELLKQIIEKGVVEVKKTNNTATQQLRSIRNIYDDLFQSYSKKLEQDGEYINILKELTGMNQGPLFTAMETKEFVYKLGDLIPLTKDDFKVIANIDDPLVSQYFADKNLELLKKIEDNKKKMGYTVAEVPNVAADQILDAIINTYKGKVLFIDFWATWCGPCRMAMEEAEPVKSALVDKEIVYIYLTGNSSPQQTWQNMIPDINGIHYRMNANQWDIICNKYRIDGVPSYMIVGKDGKQVHFQSTFMGASSMKEMLLHEAVK